MSYNDTPADKIPPYTCATTLVDNVDVDGNPGWEGEQNNTRCTIVGGHLSVTHHGPFQRSAGNTTVNERGWNSGTYNRYNCFK